MGGGGDQFQEGGGALLSIVNHNGSHRLENLEKENSHTKIMQCEHFEIVLELSDHPWNIENGSPAFCQIVGS